MLGDNLQFEQQELALVCYIREASGPLRRTVICPLGGNLGGLEEKRNAWVQDLLLITGEEMKILLYLPSQHLVSVDGVIGRYLMGFRHHNTVVKRC